VTSFGIFVEIAEPFVEGLVRTERLGGERYVFDERSVRLVQPASGRSFALGDKVTVGIDNVSVQRRKIDMSLVDHVSLSPPVPLEPRRRSRQPGKDGERRAHPRGKAAERPQGAG